MTPTSQPRIRKIVRIDEARCNGCGECAPSCAEGAIRIVNGKARLVSDNLCDGLGACLGHCPMDAISIEERPADEFDHVAVAAHTQAPAAARPGPMATFTPVAAPAHGGGCPGSRMRTFEPAPATSAATPSAAQPSMLRQWPVQLALLPVQAPIWQDADLLLAADCVPFACANFHSTMLPGKSLAIACPKLDNVEPYIDKLAQIISLNSIRSITVARMEVPCCYGLVRLVETALQKAGKTAIPVGQIVVSIRGQMKA